MDTYNIIGHTLSISIALSALIFSIIKYKKHEKRLNVQQAKINEYYLKKNTK